MSECEYCGSTVENPAHQVVNGRIYLNDASCCQNCGFDDEEMLAWTRNHQAESLSSIRNRLEGDDE
ncbi:hypothetical protein DNAM5_20 [Haloarcula californiae tailed virus 1]|uniref:Uncharacterized protein n=1 Tax=Haloarcula californiae tailed virus 1 TaxID=1273746 RepID=R4TNT4_9CAUD|nr:hypothetical protein M202_gp020 [Haloarcula californiae tailed virus 1]AGM11883.1 hypothetical protein DNAM5_20 [Haloarcula californiae tailed virus 1]